MGTDLLNQKNKKSRGNFLSLWDRILKRANTSKKILSIPL